MISAVFYEKNAKFQVIMASQSPGISGGCRASLRVGLCLSARLCGCVISSQICVLMWILYHFDGILLCYWYFAVVLLILVRYFWEIMLLFRCRHSIAPPVSILCFQRTTVVNCKQWTLNCNPRTSPAKGTKQQMVAKSRNQTYVSTGKYENYGQKRTQQYYAKSPIMPYFEFHI